MGKNHRLVVHGAAGRMGQRIVACAATDTVPWQLVAAIERTGHPKLGADAGALAGIGEAGVAISDAWSCPADVVIDFSLPEAVPGIVRKCLEAGVPLVVATTGFDDAVRATIAAAAKTIPVLQAPSMSLAVNIAMDLVGRAGMLLKRVGPRAAVDERHFYNSMAAYGRIIEPAAYRPLPTW